MVRRSAAPVDAAETASFNEANRVGSTVSPVSMARPLDAYHGQRQMSASVAIGVAVALGDGRVRGDRRVEETFVSPHGRLGTIANAVRAEDRLDVDFHGRFGNIELA